MAFTDPRGIGISDQGNLLVTLMACTLADYSAGGTQTPLVDDIVTFSSTGDFFVKRVGDEKAANCGRVTKIAVAPVGTAVGAVSVEWLDVSRFVRLDCSVLANATRGNVCEKAGADTVAHDWDAPDATGGNLLCIAKSAATGAGFLEAAVLYKDL